MFAFRKLLEPNVDKMAAKKDIPGLIKAMGHKNFDTSSSATAALCTIGRPALEPLITALTNQAENRAVRNRAAQVLGKIGDRRAIDPLIAALKDPGILGWTAARALGAIGACLLDPHERNRIVTVLTVAKGRDEYMGQPALEGLMEMGVFGSPRLQNPEHYCSETLAVGGDPHWLTLEQAEAGPFGLTLVYRWQDKLPPKEAGLLDSRLRAYIACAVYDAANAAGQACYEGEPVGGRPAWNMTGEPIAYGLQEASFDTNRQACRLRVGPVVRPGRVREQGQDGPRIQVLTALAEGFRKHFNDLTV